MPRVDGIEAARRLLGPQGPRSHQRRLGTLQLKGVVAAPSEYSAMPILHRPGDRGRLHGGGPLADVGGGRLADHGDVLRLLGMRERVERPCSPRRSPSEPGRRVRPTSAVHGLVAEQEDHLAGLAHLVLYPTTWATHPTCYLEDLYVAKPWRGGDVAHRLIEAVYAFADGFGPIGPPRSTTPRHAPYATPSPIGHRSSYTSAEFAGRFRAVRPTPAAARGRSAAQRRGRDRGVRRLPQLHLSTPQHESQPTAESS